MNFKPLKQPEAEMLTFRVESLEALLSVFSEHHKPCRWMFLVELLMRLLVAQKDFGLPYLPEFSLVAVSMSALLCRAEFEHEQLTILKLLFFLKQWMVEGFSLQLFMHILSWNFYSSILLFLLKFDCEKKFRVASLYVNQNIN